MPTGDGRFGELRAATYGRGIWQVPLLTAIAPSVPAITLSPTSLTFASQQSGTASAAMLVTVTNTGSAALSVSSVVPTDDFTESDTCTTSPIAVGATCTVEVIFLPTAAGTRNGVLTVYGNVVGGQATAALTGTATFAATVVLTPSSLTFPATTVGATSAVQNITVANTGGTSATLQLPTVSGDFTLAANLCGSTLAPQTSCTLSIAFHPTVSGARTGTLTVVDSAGTQVAALTGSGTSPATDALSPLSLSFAAQQLTTASATQSVTLTNAGGVALTLISAQITTGDFTVVSGCGVSLAAQSSCTFAVAFLPRSLGTQSGTLTLSDQFRTQTVALAGLGVAPPGASLAPLGGLAFPATGLGLSAPAQTVTLTNNGGLPLTLAGMGVTGDFSIVPGTNTCTATLAPAAVCSLGVTFAPVSAGPRTGLLTLTDNAANSPQTLALGGTGVDFTLTVNGAATQTVASGTTATYALFLSSSTGVSGAVPFTCSGVPAHALCSVNPTPGALGGTSAVTVTVATGLTTATLSPPPVPWQRQLVWLAVLLPFGLLVRRRKAVALLVLIALAGCGTSRTEPAASSGGGAVATPHPERHLHPARLRLQRRSRPLRPAHPHRQVAMPELSAQNVSRKAPQMHANRTSCVFSSNKSLRDLTTCQATCPAQKPLAHAH